MVLRFRHTDADAGWLQTMATNADVFGPGRFDE
jgi:hypothetical protein